MRRSYEWLCDAIEAEQCKPNFWDKQLQSVEDPAERASAVIAALRDAVPFLRELVGQDHMFRSAMISGGKGRECAASLILFGDLPGVVDGLRALLLHENALLKARMIHAASWRDSELERAKELLTAAHQGNK
ncbi:MAG TPA: hypothetical protein VFK05_25645 [Polyangiaceae bacterium]|nr:hypothetical protein [Polyangiaceae bacterium]